MSREILNQVDDDDLDIQESKEVCISKILAEKIEHVYFDTFADNIRLHKIMNDCSHSQNLASMKPSKINPEIECAHHILNNTSFVMKNKKSLYSSQNYVVKTVSKLSNITNHALLASDSNSLEGLLDHSRV